MNSKAGNLIVIAVFAIVGSTACHKGDNKLVAGTTPIDQLIRAGKSPLETGPISREVNPDTTKFVMTVTNVSDTPVKEFNGTTIFYDESGKALDDTIMISRYAVAPDAKIKLPYIHPGAEFKMRFQISNKKAVSGKFILKDVLYEKKVDPKLKNFIEIWSRWTNKDHDTILEAEKAKKIV